MASLEVEVSTGDEYQPVDVFTSSFHFAIMLLISLLVSLSLTHPFARSVKLITP